MIYLRMTSRVQPSMQDASESLPEVLEEDINQKLRFESEQAQTILHLELGIELASRSAPNDLLVDAPVNVSARIVDEIGMNASPK